jgi:hypothetical protein
MSSVENRRPRHRRQSAAQLQRDAALVRVSRTRRFVIGGAAALSAGIAALVSAVAPGHTLGAKTADAATSSGTSGSGSGSSTAHASAAAKRMPPLAKPSDLGLAGPPSGPTASSGAGNSGNSGNTGPAGNSGNTGSTGSTGNSGNTGITGSTGNTGVVGNSGPVPQAAPVTSGGS